MHGYLLIDKPNGWTSFDVVAKIRNTIKSGLNSQESGKNKIKVGHTGTLDPMATGLVVILVGSYTKKADELTKLDKDYLAEITLGATSTTDDAEGEIVPKSSIKPTPQDVTSVLNSFLGKQQQVPPQFSAIKIKGKKAYEVARKGGKNTFEPRKVNIYTISDIKYSYPKICFGTSVSSGTYIRSIARDLGEKLGTGAYLTALRRTRIGEFNINNSVSIDGITLDIIKAHLKQLD